MSRSWEVLPRNLSRHKQYCPLSFLVTYRNSPYFPVSFWVIMELIIPLVIFLWRHRVCTCFMDTIQVINLPQHTPSVRLSLPSKLYWNSVLLPDIIIILDTCLAIYCTHKKNFLRVNGPWSSVCPLDILSGDLRPKILCHQHSGINHNSVLRCFHQHSVILKLNL